MNRSNTRTRCPGSRGLWIAFLAQVLIFDMARGTATAYLTLDLRTQLQRADHVVHAKIVEVTHLGAREVNEPVGSCGVLYKFRVLEQFKGQLTAEASFVTHRILFHDRPLSVGDQALILLRDLNMALTRDDELFREELELSYAAVTACGDPGTSLYLATYEENIFPMVFETQGSTNVAWLEYHRTLIPAGAAPTTPGRCEPVESGGCIWDEAPRVEWRALRSVIRRWTAEK